MPTTSDGAKIIANVQTELEALAERIRANDFSVSMTKALATAAAALAKMRGETPSAVEALVGAVKQAFSGTDGAAARKALEDLADHFSIEINTPPPTTVTTSRAGVGETIWLGNQPVRLSASELSVCREMGADVRDYARNKITRARARGDLITSSGRIQEQRGNRT